MESSDKATAIIFVAFFVFCIVGAITSMVCDAYVKTHTPITTIEKDK